MGRSSRLLTTTEGRNTSAFAATDWALFAAISLSWGSSFLFIDVGLDHFEPGVIAWLRVALGALTIAVLPFDKGSVDRSDWPRILVLSVIWLAVPTTLFALAQQWINSSVTGMLNAAVPSLTALVASVMLRRKPGRLQQIGITVGFVGVLLISIPNFSTGGTEWAGVLAVLAATVCYAFSANIVAPLQQRYGSLPVLARVLAGAVVLNAPFAIAGIGESTFAWDAVAAMAALGIVGTGLAFIAYSTLIGRAGATRASGVTYVIPVVAVLLGVQVRGDSVGGLAIIGCVAVVTGTAFTSRDGH